MALGQVRDENRIAFEGDYQLLGFQKMEAKGNYSAWGKYKLMNANYVTLDLSGWSDSGCENLKIGGWYHFYFEYSFYQGNVKVRVLGCNPDLTTEVKIKPKKEPLEMDL